MHTHDFKIVDYDDEDADLVYCECSCGECCKMTIDGNRLDLKEQSYKYLPDDIEKEAV